MKSDSNAIIYSSEGKQSIIAKFFLHLSAIEFLFFSGATYIVNTYFGIGPASMIIYVFTCWLCCITNRKFQIQGGNARKMLFICFWITISTVVFGQGAHTFVFVSYIFFAFGTLLLVTASNFYTFRSTLLRYLTLLSLISIIVQVGHEFYGLFPSKPFVYSDGISVHYYSFIFNTGIAQGKRLASIYWEPGQYQIVIIYILGLFADEWSDIYRWKSNLKKFGVLLIALILTLSTMAYLMMLLMMVIIMVRSARKSLKLISPILLSGMIAANFIINSEAIQNKVNEREEEKSNSSYTIRLADNIGCLMVTLEDPLTGFGPGSDVLESRLLSQGSMTSSNGWLFGAAQLGIPYIVFLWFCMWGNIKKLNPKTSTFLLFLLLVISQCNEAGIAFPYIFMYVFSFPSLITNSYDESYNCHSML